MALGLTHYFTGKPCKRGHIEQRAVARKKCLACEREGSAAFRTANPDKIRGTNARQYQKNRAERLTKAAEYRSSHKEQIAAYNPAYYQKNAERMKAERKAYYAANRAIVRACNDAWAKANPDRDRIIRAAVVRNRRARLRAAEGHHTAEDIRRIHAAQKGKCAECREKVGVRYHVDHITPLALGGSNAARNLQILCPGCNYRKNAKDPIDFARERGRLL